MPTEKDIAFNQEATNAHNKYRSLHDVPLLRMSDDLIKSAQDWAEKLVNKPKLENSPISCKGDVGENISSRSSTGNFVDLSGQEVTDQWYKDISHYDFDSGTGNAGNFTQLVWAGSKEVGFGKAHNNGKCIVVAHYKPPGNVRGRYKENVLKPTSSPPISQGATTAEEGAEEEAEAQVAELAMTAACPDQEVDLGAVVEDPAPCGEVVGDEGTAPPRGQKTKTTVVTETVTEPNGKTYTVKREIEEYTDDFGNITERVKEIRLDNPEAGAGGSAKETSSSSEDEKILNPPDDQAGEDEEEILNPPDVQAGEDEEEAGGESNGGEKRELNIFARDLIDTHNAYRKKHGSPPLNRNKELDKMAQEWAETLVVSERLSNSNYTYKGNRLGENIASRWSNGPCDSAGNEVSDHWYSEEKKYDYDTEPSNVQGIGNFTQLVWRNSKEVGVGKAIHTDKDGTKVITVCLYHPAGNVLQCFRDNVLKP